MEPKIKENKEQQEVPQNGQFDSMEIMAEMSNTNIEMRDIVDRWLLLCYDIPHTPEGDKARREFLVEAALLGVSQFTESVYLLPWTPAAELIALRVARAGKAVVWTSSLTDQGKAAEITRNYDSGIKSTLDKIAERIDRIVEHNKKKRFKRAFKMKAKTDRMLNGMDEALAARGSQTLTLLQVMLKRRFANC